jgi:hypothetical protein
MPYDYFYYIFDLKSFPYKEKIGKKLQDSTTFVLHFALIDSFFAEIRADFKLFFGKWA